MCNSHPLLSAKIGKVLCKGAPLGRTIRVSRDWEEGLLPLAVERTGPLQYSGLENSMDCIVHGVAKNRTQLSSFHSLSHLEII